MAEISIRRAGQFYAHTTYRIGGLDSGIRLIAGQPPVVTHDAGIIAAALRAPGLKVVGFEEAAVDPVPVPAKRAKAVRPSPSPEAIAAKGDAQDSASAVTPAAVPDDFVNPARGAPTK